MDPVRWSEEEFGSTDLGDVRRLRRLLRMAARVAESPSGTVSAVFPDAAEREGAYRLLSNEAVDSTVVADSSHAACVARCAGEDFVFVPEDGSSLNITDTTRTKGTGPIGARKMGGRGFQVMNAIAVRKDGVPLGLCGQAWWSRTEKADRRANKSKRTEEKETKHWGDVMSAVRERFSGTGTIPWFQLDRGGDAWPVFVEAQSSGQWVTVRSSSDRRIVNKSLSKRTYLRETMAAEKVLGSYELPVIGGHGRAPRAAHMEVRTRPVVLMMIDDRTSQIHQCPVWCVWTVEAGTVPVGEKPLNWMLLTTRPVQSFADAKLTIFGYSLRWRVEEFHKAWKTGACDVEDLQIRSEDAIRTWTILLAASAMRLLRMTYLARHQPTLPATEEFTEDEIHAVHIARNKEWNGKRPPAIAELTLWIANLGGYAGKSNGPPGMIVLARGWRRVAPIVPVVARLRGLQPVPDTM